MELEHSPLEQILPLLRDVALHKRQGVLTLTHPTRSGRLLFQQGKLIEFENGETPAVVELAHDLCNAGYVQGGDWIDSLGTYSDLLIELEHQGSPIDATTLQILVRERVLQHACALQRFEKGSATFKVELVPHEEEFSPCISLGLIMLDLISDGDDESDFRRKIDPQTVLALAPDSSFDQKTNVEMLVCDMFREGVSVATAQQRSLLSAAQFREAVLVLFEEGTLRSVHVDGGNVEKEPAQDQLLATLEASIDKALEGVIDGVHAYAPPPETFQDTPQHGTTHSWQERICALSQQLLTRSDIPHLVGIAIALISLFVPLLFWKELLFSLGGR